MDTTTIWTAGACQGNPGPGGYAVTIRLPDGSKDTKANGRRLTTPRRMEIYAAIRGLSLLPPGCPVVIRSSSKYLVTCLKARAYDKDEDLWERLMPLATRHSLRAMLATPDSDPTALAAHQQAHEQLANPPTKADVGYEMSTRTRY